MTATAMVVPDRMHTTATMARTTLLSREEGALLLLVSRPRHPSGNERLPNDSAPKSTLVESSSGDC